MIQQKAHQRFSLGVLFIMGRCPLLFFCFFSRHREKKSFCDLSSLCFRCLDFFLCFCLHFGNFGLAFCFEGLRLLAERTLHFHLVEATNRTNGRANACGKRDKTEGRDGELHLHFHFGFSESLPCVLCFVLKHFLVDCGSNFHHNQVPFFVFYHYYVFFGHFYDDHFLLFSVHLRKNISRKR